MPNDSCESGLHLATLRAFSNSKIQAAQGCGSLGVRLRLSHQWGSHTHPLHPTSSGSNNAIPQKSGNTHNSRPKYAQLSPEIRVSALWVASATSSPLASPAWYICLLSRSLSCDAQVDKAWRMRVSQIGSLFKHKFNMLTFIITSTSCTKGDMTLWSK